MNTPPTDPGGAIWAFNEWENGECVLIDCEGNIIHRCSSSWGTYISLGMCDEGED
jgi:hypothetical protein